MIEHIAFPLTASTYPDRFADADYYEDEATIPVATITVEELKKALEVKKTVKYDLIIQDSFSLTKNYSDDLLLRVRRLNVDSEWAEVMEPEAGSTFSIDWLMENLDALNNGADFTEGCLRIGNTMVVIDNYSSNYSIPYTLFKLLELQNPRAIEYPFEALTDEKYDDEGRRVLIPTPKLKHLIADMKLKGMTGTSVYKALDALLAATGEE